MQHQFDISTRGPGLYEFTGPVAQFVAGQGDGLLSLFIRHTSASLLIMENADPKVQTDLQAFFDRLVPPSDHPAMAYLRHTFEGPDDMPAHIKATLMPVSLCVPVQNGRLQLGTWQGIFVFEHRTHPHARTVAAHFLPDTA